jgi:dipeptidyl aminopeptidase/acylaminoacyl peptidase
MKKLLLVNLLLIAAIAIKAQQKDFPKLTGPYFGQNSPGNIPEIFAPGIVSTENAWEAAISFSPDGKEFFFTRRENIQGNENRILHSELINGKWTVPKPPPFAKDLIEYESFISPDGKKIFYNSDRPKSDNPAAVGEIWYSEKTPGGWSEGKYLTETINKGWIMFVTASMNNNLYFTAGFNRKFGIYKSEFKDGVYQEPEFLPDEINYLRGAHPFISPDESYLIFDAQPEGMGKSQLYISFKDKNGKWMKAVKFDKSINKTFTENIPNVSPDGKYFFFHRNNDIYWVSSKIIEDLKPEE